VSNKLQIETTMMNFFAINHLATIEFEKEINTHILMSLELKK